MLICSKRRTLAQSTIALLFFFLLVQASRAQDIGSLGEQKPLGLSGAISLSGTFYSSEGIAARRTPFSWILSGSPMVSVYGVQMPFNFLLSDQERSFRQPFDQFGVSPSYKSATLHLGYRSMTLSRYSLAGVTFLGAGIEFNPSPLRFAAMIGRLQRAVGEDTNNLDIQPAYARQGRAIKLGIGSDRTFFELNYLHAADDSNSIRQPTAALITPQENAVLGINSKITFIDQLSLEVEAAASALTRNIKDSLAKVDVPDIVNSFISGIRASTSLTTAGRAALAFSIPHFMLRLGYERIEPDYTSLGAYYFTTDIENYTIAPTIDFLDNKVRVSGSVGIQHDNLLNLKLARTQRIIGSGTVSWNPSQVFGVDAQYSNYSTDQSSGRAPLNDSIKVRNVSESATLSPRITLQSTELTQAFSLIASLQQYTDLNSRTNQAVNSDTKTASLNYSAFFINSGSNVGGALLFADTKAGTIRTQLIGVNLSGGLSLVNNTLSLGGTFGVTHSSVPVGLTFNETLSSTYRLGTNDNIGLSVYATQNSATAYVPKGFSEMTATVTLSHNFAY